MAAVIGGRAPAQETIGARLRRLARSARFNNQYVNGTMTSPPTITTPGSSVTAGLTNAYRLVGPPSKLAAFREFGGEPFVFASTFHRFPVMTANGSGVGGNVTGARSGTGWQVECMPDASKICFRLLGSTQPYRFLVASAETAWKLQYVDLAGTVTAVNTGTQHITLDFGTRARRVVVVEGELGTAIDGAYVGTIETIDPTDGTDVLRAVCLTDSYGSTVVGGRVNDAFTYVMGRALGLRDIRSSAAGGTGWLNSVGGTAYTIGQRIAVDLVPQNPDVAFIAAGTNDNATGIAAEVTVRIREFRAAMPRVPLFVFGPWPQATGPDAAKTAVEAAISAGVTAAGDPLTVFVPVISDPAGSWISGTGRAGSPTGTGNSDIYTSPDGVHLSAAGHLFLGLRAADAVMSKLPLLA